MEHGSGGHIFRPWTDVVFGVRLALAAFTMAACVVPVPVPAPDTSTTAESMTASSTTLLEEPTSLLTTTTPIEPGRAGSLSEPLPVGEVAVVGDWVVRVVSVDAEAGKEVEAENEFKDPPGDGKVFFMATLEATYQGSDSSTFWVDMTLKTVGPSNVAYEAFDASCGVIPNSIDNAGETFLGGTITGNACWEVDVQDADSLILIAEQTFSLEPTRVLFALTD